MIIKPWYVKKTAESFVRQKIRSPCGRENRSKPVVLSLLEISPLSRFCSYYGDRSELSEAALEEKDPWRDAARSGPKLELSPPLVSPLASTRRRLDLRGAQTMAFGAAAPVRLLPKSTAPGAPPRA
jgi:hypothetical protein